MSQIRLLAKRKFFPLFVTQFFGAFNDNFLKNAFVILVTYKEMSIWGIPSDQMVALIGGLFVLPFFLFSAHAGALADKIDKTQIIRVVKFVEVGIMAIASIGFFTHSANVLLGAVFLMGIHSCVFGPVKFSILPQHLSDDEIIGGNALVEAGTFLAVLTGTIAGGILILLPNGSLFITVGLLLASVIGLIACYFIPAAPPSGNPVRLKWEPIQPTLEILKASKKVPSVFNSILGVSWFWFLGACFVSLFPLYAKETLNAGQGVVTLFLAFFSIGIAMGSLMCERLSRHHLELGLVPFGSIGMTIFAADLFWASAINLPVEPFSVSAFWNTPGSFRICFDLFAFSLFAGFYIVPMNTLIQLRSTVAERSRVIAANNIVNSLFMVAGSLYLVVCLGQKLSIPLIFLSLAAMNAFVAIYIYTIIPEFLLRFVVWGMANIIYRMKIEGRENIPKSGPAVLVCNHVTFIDWMIIAAAIKRPIRFVMHYSFMKGFIIKRLLTRAKAIPIASSWENEALLVQAFQSIAQELREGELVCIFPEGKLTKDGKMNPFKTGVEKIIQETPVPVIPMVLQNMWGSFFSKEGGKAVFKRPKRFWSRVGLVIDEPIPPDQITAEKLYNKVASLL